MTDLTKIEKPFGLLDKDTQDALEAAFEAGVKIEQYNGSWGSIDTTPQWFRTVTYRAKPEPVRVVLYKTYRTDGRYFGSHVITCNPDGTEPTITWETST
tara:strand:+ start:520 stop:816 length:297 start_codon:yes stop_codon:yes gene_type:complete